jgi:hypothetical protein
MTLAPATDGHSAVDGVTAAAVDMVRRGPPAPLRRLIALPVMLTAAVILSLALPRALAGLVTGAGQPAIRKVDAQQPVSIDEVETLIAAQQRGLRITADPRLGLELGRGHLLMVEKLSLSNPAARAHLEQAIAALRGSVAAAPAAPLAWTLLAYAQFLRDSEWTVDSLAALQVAIETGPFDPSLLWSRLRLALFAWDDLPPDARDLVKQQIRFAWTLGAEPLAAMVSDLNRADLVRAVLQASPDDLAAFEKLLPPRAAP